MKFFRRTYSTETTVIDGRPQKSDVQLQNEKRFLRRRRVRLWMDNLPFLRPVRAK